MRDIHTSTITDAVKRLCVEANWNLEPTCSACSTAQPAQVTHAEEQKRLADHKGVALIGFGTGSHKSGPGGIEEGTSRHS